MFILLFFILVIIVAVYLFMNSARFGKTASGDRLMQIESSPNFQYGRFQNVHDTPALTEGTSYFKILKDFFLNNGNQKIPPAALPHIKTDLLKTDPDQNILVWFGHSSYFLQIDGKKILVDPVFSGNASPLRFTTRSFKGSDIYTSDDMPLIDYLFLTHDHWDHLDYKTIIALKPKVKKVITSLGVGAHLEYWGYNKNIMDERDWNAELILGKGFKVNTVSARHFSGRGFKRNGSLWMSFVLSTPTMQIFIGGDSGYDQHFEEIGNKFGPFDLVILENGQYDRNWKYIHMMPEETVQAAIDLKAKRLLPVHWAKFSLSVHAWDEPIRRLKKEATARNMILIHPKIGETVLLNQNQVFHDWWESIQ